MPLTWTAGSAQRAAVKAAQGELTDEDEPNATAVAAIGLIGAVVLGLGIVALRPLMGPGRVHVTECGFDAYGPYAKVRVASLWGGLGTTDHAQVSVAFTYDGAWYGDDGAYIRVKLPVLGTSTGVVHGTYPPRVIPPRWSGRNGKIIVEGRTVYRVADGFGDREENWPGRLVTKEFVARQLQLHPHRFVADEEIVPDDLHRISCSVAPLRTDQ